MKSDPLSDTELDFVESTLLKYGNDDSILDASELDGFVVALISGPEVFGCQRYGAALCPSSAKRPNCSGL